MKLNILPSQSSSRKELFFTGINRREFIQDTEIKDGTNLSSEYLPALCQRYPREVVHPAGTVVEPVYLFNAGGKFCWVDGDSFYYDGVLKGTVDGDTHKSMVDFNGFVVIFPDKRYYCYDSLNPEYDVFGTFGAGDCEDVSLYTAVSSTMSVSSSIKKFGNGSIECTSTAGTGYYGCKSKTNNFKIDSTQYYIVAGYAKSSTNARLKVLKGSDDAIASTGSDTDTDDEFKRVYAIVTPKDIEGEKYINIQVEAVSSAIGQKLYVDGLMAFPITKEQYDDAVYEDEDYIASLVFTPIPEIDYCSQHYNRVFGGKDSNVYASAWGDFKTWSKFEGTNQDSFATDVATEGVFTGMYTFGNHVTYFKDNWMEEIYGSLPRNYQLMTVGGFGAISNDAVAEAGSYMMFADSVGVYLYSGGNPTEIGEPLNEKGYSNVKISSDGERFYVLFIYPSRRKMYAYNIAKQSWMPEDDLNVVSFTSMNREVYALISDGSIIKFNSGTEKIHWNAETKVFDDSLFEKKKTRNVKLKLRMEAGSSITVFSKKNDELWKEEFTVSNAIAENQYETVRKVVSINRANRYQLKFSGFGEVLIYGEREFDIGSQF